MQSYSGVHFNTPSPAEGELDVQVTQNGVQTCVNIVIDKDCSADVIFQWYNWSEATGDDVWLFNESYWYTYFNWTNINTSQQLCAWQNNVSCYTEGDWTTASSDWRVIAEFTCSQYSYNEVSQYQFQPEACPIFYIHPQSPNGTVCPCCDAMCVGVDSDHNVNITVYRSSESIDVYGYNTSWCNTGPSNYTNSFTIDHTYIDSDLTGFPVLVNLSNSIVSKADGGNSLRFYDSDSNLLAHEVEYWGTYALLWVNITFISSSIDTVFYVYYNDSTATTVEDPPAVWDSKFVMIQHMKDNTTSDILDSTSNNNKGIKKDANEPIENSSGKVGPAQDFDGADDYINCLNNNSLEIDDTVTMEAWIKTSSSVLQVVMGKDFREYEFMITSTNFNLRYGDGSNYETLVIAGSGNVIDNNWHYIVGIINKSIGTGYIYVDGNYVGTYIQAVRTGHSSRNVEIGHRTSSTKWFNGTMDEVRISNVVRSPSWISASHDSQSQTPGFLTISPQSWCGASTSNYSTPITINHDLIDADLINFPILVNLSNSIVSMADGGNSLRFYDSSCNLLPHEIEYWGTYAIVWVKLGSISSTADTTFYVYYNDTTATSAENPHAVWDLNFVMVQHMTDNTTSTISDSTSNNNDGAKKGANEPIEATGKIAKGQDFDGTDDYLRMPDDNTIDLGVLDFSIGCWMKTTTLDVMTLVQKKLAQPMYRLYTRPSDPYVRMYIQDGSGAAQTSSEPVSISDGDWHYVVGIRAGDDILTYIDGCLKSTDAGASGIDVTNTEDLFIGANPLLSTLFNGTIDEVRLSNVARTPVWINTSFNSQNQTTDFLSFGVQEHNWIVIDHTITNEYIANIYTNVTNGTHCFCIDGHINNSIYIPMRFNEIYYWYVNVTDVVTGDYIVSDTFQFSTAANILDCPCGEDIAEYSQKDYIIGLIGIMGIIGLLGYFYKRRNRG